MNNGIYISLEGDIIHRCLANNGNIKQLEDTSFADEIINNLELDTTYYEKAIDKLSELFEPDTSSLVAIEPEYFYRIRNIVFDLVKGIAENDIIMGELLFTDLTINTDVHNDYSLNNCLSAMKKTMTILRDALYTIFLMDKLMYLNYELNDPDKWFDEYVMNEPDLFGHRIVSEFRGSKSNIGDPGLTQVYFFSSFVDYFTFLMMNFAMQKKQVKQCQCCGNYFIPSTKKNTLYCDRALLIDGRTCKQGAPKLVNKIKNKKDSLLEKYERVRNRNYKRYERWACKLDNKRTDKDLSYGDYLEWLKQVKEARKLYVLGQLSAAEFEKVIDDLERS